MTATEPAQQRGKCTQGALSVGEATRMLTRPQAPYADAITAALDAVSMPPASLEIGLRTGRTGACELYAHAVWPVGSPVLAAPARARGLTLAWSHVTGWSVRDTQENHALLDVDPLAAPELVADAARHHARHGIDQAHPWVPPSDGRWSEAVYLDIALALFEEQGGPTW